MKRLRNLLMMVLVTVFLCGISVGAEVTISSLAFIDASDLKAGTKYNMYEASDSVLCKVYFGQNNNKSQAWYIVGFT